MPTRTINVRMRGRELLRCEALAVAISRTKSRPKPIGICPDSDIMEPVGANLSHRHHLPCFFCRRFKNTFSMSTQKAARPSTNPATSKDDRTLMPLIASNAKAPNANTKARKPVSRLFFIPAPPMMSWVECASPSTANATKTLELVYGVG